MASPAPNRVYEDFDPPSDLVSEEACDTLLVYLPGYKKEQLRVQLTPSRILKLSGERPIGENKWRRFQKEFRVPSNCDTRGISAKFEGGILYIRQPKVITPATTTQPQPEDKGKAALEPPQPQPPLPPLPQPEPQPQPEKEQAPPKPSKEEEEKESKGERMVRKDEIAQAPEPKPQPIEEAPPSHLPKEVEKEKKGERKEDEERKDTMSKMIKKSPRQVFYESGLFRELRKPENMKRLVVSTVLVLAIGFYASYIFKSFTGNEQQNGSAYDNLDL